MKRIAIAVLLMGLMVFGCSEEENASDDVFDIAEVEEMRERKDEEFKGEQSPLPVSDRASFKGLKYFEISEDYAVEATIRWNVQSDTIKIATSKDDIRPAIKVLRMVFTIKGKQCELNGYRFVKAGFDESSVFVPFADKTNGNETYEAGRYIDLDITPGAALVLLDFNKAYQPYCVYNHDYSCPLVPAENRLPVRIEAGERL